MIQSQPQLHPNSELGGAYFNSDGSSNYNLESKIFSSRVIPLLREAMQTLREYQLYGQPGDAAEIKPDLSLVTAVDTKIGASLRIQIADRFPDAKLNLEDAPGLTPPDEAKKLFLIDPLDGTRPFANGIATSTIIIGCVDVTTHELTNVAIGDPATGRIWIADGRETVQEIYPVESKLPVLDRLPCIVWQGELDSQSTILIDTNKGFSRNGRPILHQEEVESLMVQTTRENHLMMLGSNGMHHATVANGGDRMAGGITTAIGGAWDVCGVLLILRAGGAARAFAVTTNDKQRLVEKNPLHVLDYDILVYGNSEATVDVLVSRLEKAIS